MGIKFLLQRRSRKKDQLFKVPWIIGDPETWPQEMVEQYFFTPVGDVENFEWQREQHACLVCPNGDIMCFDNGQYRSKHKEKFIRNRDNWSRGVRYRIDTEKMEIEQVWQYGKEWGQEFFSPYISNVEFYDEDHCMIHSGGLGTVKGFASDGLPASLGEEDPDNFIHSITVEEKDGVVLFELDAEGNFYRGERLPLYHDGDNLMLGKGEVLGSLEVTEEFDTVPEVPKVQSQPDSFHEIKIEEEPDRILSHGRFEKGTLVMLYESIIP